MDGGGRTGSNGCRTTCAGPSARGPLWSAYAHRLMVCVRVSYACRCDLSCACRYHTVYVSRMRCCSTPARNCCSPCTCGGARRTLKHVQKRKQWLPMEWALASGKKNELRYADVDQMLFGRQNRRLYVCAVVTCIQLCVTASSLHTRAHAHDVKRRSRKRRRPRVQGYFDSEARKVTHIRDYPDDHTPGVITSEVCTHVWSPYSYTCAPVCLYTASGYVRACLGVFLTSHGSCSRTSVHAKVLVGLTSLFWTTTRSGSSRQRTCSSTSCRPSRSGLRAGSVRSTQFCVVCAYIYI